MTEGPGLASRLASLLDPEAARPAEEWAVDGVVPEAASAPADEAGVAAVLGLAAGLGLAVAPRGAGTRSGLGMPPTRLDLVLSLERLRGVVAHERDDQTVAVRAGTPCRELAAHLARAGQWLPWLEGLEGTVGGAAAAGASGPWRERHGTAREAVIQAVAVLADGRRVRSGARVVKNVTGYDLHRLWVGSLGTLAVLVELAFRVEPRPEALRGWLASFPDTVTLAAAARELRRPPLAPYYLEAEGPPWRLHAAYGGEPEEADWALDQARRRAGGEEATGVPPAPPRGEVVFRLSAPPSRLGEVLGLAASLGEAPRIGAHAGVGVVRAVLDARLAAPLLEAAARAAFQGARALGGHAVLETAPAALKGRVGVWGEPRGDADLCRRLKERFDPGGVLNPGRYYAGI